MSKDYGFKVSKQGKDITSTDKGDYIDWSKYHSRTVVISGTAQITVNDNSESTLTIYHNLGYIPQVALFTIASTNNRSVKIPFEFWDTSSGYIEEALIVKLYTDRIEIPFSRYSTGSNYTYTVKYLIFMEEAKVS